MFSYYGSKSKVVDYYPPPKYDKIIEPFAGSARYSLKYWNKNVLLVDLYPDIIKIWKWIQSGNIENEITKIPYLKKGDNIKNLDISKECMLFLGFVVNQGVSSPKYTVTEFAQKSVNKSIRNLINTWHRIKHWEIVNTCYKRIDNEECTWFIDPPYQYGGEHYKESNKNIDFKELSEWCMSRKGQVIVCENTKADWMDFKPMVNMTGALYTTTEAIWTNLPTSYGVEQKTLF